MNKNNKDAGLPQPQPALGDSPSSPSLGNSAYHVGMEVMMRYVKCMLGSEDRKKVGMHVALCRECHRSYELVSSLVERETLLNQAVDFFSGFSDVVREICVAAFEKSLEMKKHITVQPYFYLTPIMLPGRSDSGSERGGVEWLTKNAAGKNDAVVIKTQKVIKGKLFNRDLTYLTIIGNKTNQENTGDQYFLLQGDRFYCPKGVFYCCEISEGFPEIDLPNEESIYMVILTNKVIAPPEEVDLNNTINERPEDLIRLIGHFYNEIAKDRIEAYIFYPLQEEYTDEVGEVPDFNFSPISFEASVSYTGAPGPPKGGGRKHLIDDLASADAIIAYDYTQLIIGNIKKRGVGWKPKLSGSESQFMAFTLQKHK